MKTYSPFSSLHSDRFDVVDNVTVRKNKKGDVCLNQYVLHRVIGRGSYATVRLAYDSLDEEKVAIRIVNRVALARKLGQETCDKMILNHLQILRSLDPRYCVCLKQFLYTNIYTPHITTGAPPIPISHQLAALFEDSPRITGTRIQVDDDDDEASMATSTPRACGKDRMQQQSCMFIFEYAQSTLDKELLRKDILFEQLRDYAFQTAECLSHMHQQRIVYNDLKAENLLIINGRVKLSDFDTSVQLNTSQLQYCTIKQLLSDQQLVGTHYIVVDPLLCNDDHIGDIVTTPSISAPETQNKSNIFVGTASDIWQLGQLYCRMFLGKQYNQRVERNDLNYKCITETIGANFADLIAGCTDHPAFRYTIDQVLSHPFFSQQDLASYRVDIQNQQLGKLVAEERKFMRSSTPEQGVVQRSNSVQNQRLWDYIGHGLISPLLFSLHRLERHQVPLCGTPVPASITLDKYQVPRMPQRSQSDQCFNTQLKQRLARTPLGEQCRKWATNAQLHSLEMLCDAAQQVLQTNAPIGQRLNAIHAVEELLFLIRYTQLYLFESPLSGGPQSKGKQLYSAREIRAYTEKKHFEGQIPTTPLINCSSTSQRSGPHLSNCQNSTHFSNINIVEDPYFDLSSSDDVDLPCRYQSPPAGQQKPSIFNQSPLLQQYLKLPTLNVGRPEADKRASEGIFELGFKPRQSGLTAKTETVGQLGFHKANIQPSGSIIQMVAEQQSPSAPDQVAMFFDSFCNVVKLDTEPAASHVDVKLYSDIGEYSSSSQ